MLLNFPEQQYQSYTSENKKSKQTNNTLEEMSKNQSFRILKLYLVILYQQQHQENPEFRCQLNQYINALKNMLSFMKNDDIKRQHISSEQLFQELQQSKQQINGLRDENIRLRTKIHHSEKEFVKYESMIEEISLTSNKRNNNDYTMIVLRKQLKERTIELEDKMKEMENLKKNVKVCRMQELEIEKKVYFEQTLKMKHMLNLAQDQIGYQQLKVERTQSLEQQIEQQNQTMDKMQNKQDQMLQYMEECDQAMKLIRQQLKQQALKNQQLIQKHQQLQIKFDNLNNLISSNIKLAVQIVKCCNNSPISVNLETKISNLAKEIISASEDLQRRHRNKGTNESSKNNTELISKQTSEYFQFPKDQIQFTLLKNKVTQSQFDNLLTQLKNCKDKQQFQALLIKEPLSLIEPEQLLNNLGNHNLYQQFSQQLGPYVSLEDLNELETQKTIKQDLQQTELINKYWENFKGQFCKQEILNFITQIKFDWNQQTILYYLLNIFQNGGGSFNAITLEHIKNPFPTVEDSFLRDLQITQNGNKMLDNFNPQDELLVKEFFTPDIEDLQFEHQLGLKSNKYVQPNQIQEALEEEEEVQSSMNKEENCNDLAYIESNNNGEVDLGTQSLKILND